MSERSGRNIDKEYRHFLEVQAVIANSLSHDDAMLNRVQSAFRKISLAENTQKMTISSSVQKI